MGNPLAPDSASDWANFAVNVLIAFATVAAVWVAVLGARHANTRADAADARAEKAEKRQRTIDEDNIRLQDENLRVERAELNATLDKQLDWLRTAHDYDDDERISQLDAEIFRSKTRLNQIARALNESEPFPGL